MVSHDYKLIFIHIPKCAGRSICNVFNQRFDHFTAWYYRKEYAYWWDKYDVFALVRNPYDRLVSMYNFLQHNRLVRPEPIRMNGAPFKEWVIANMKAAKSKGFFDLNSPEANWGYDWELGAKFWFSPQFRFVGGEDMAHKIKIFKIEDGLDKVEAWFNEKGVLHNGQKPKIESLNVSPKRGPWQEYYDEELYELLREKRFILDDCYAFNYEIK